MIIRTPTDRQRFNGPYFSWQQVDLRSSIFKGILMVNLGINQPSSVDAGSLQKYLKEDNIAHNQSISSNKSRSEVGSLNGNLIGAFNI